MTHPQTAAAPSSPPRGCGSDTCEHCGRPIEPGAVYCSPRCRYADEGELL